MNEIDFTDKLIATAVNLQKSARASAEEAMRANGLAQSMRTSAEDGQLLEATEILEQARDALIESGQHMMAGLKGTRLQPSAERRTSEFDRPAGEFEVDSDLESVSSFDSALESDNPAFGVSLWHEPT